ncbi:MAG: DUF4397 domain-containing protein [Gemmatimonadaceae bacterium]|nr:DUF4397 domain-containing protein [Gemmatimonadaceae bacterium]
MSSTSFPRVLLAVLSAFTLTGCYTYVPMQSSAAPNPRVEVLVTDRGRVELMPQLGQGVLSFEGILDGRRDSSYVIRVAEVTYINRQTNRWSGESITLSSEAVRDIRVRQLSRARTFAVIAGSVGAGVAFVASRGLFGGGNIDSDPNPPPPPERPVIDIRFFQSRFPSPLILMTSRLSPALRVAVAIAATGLLAACSKDTGPTVNDLSSRARVRVINAIPDTGAMDYRFVDSVEAPIELGLVFRQASSYLPFKAGARRLRAFAASSVPAIVFGAPILDQVINLEADKFYTIIHVGRANTGGAGDSVIVLTDTLPTTAFLGSGIAIRGVHAIPGVGAVNVFTTRNVSAALPATPAFANLTYGGTTGYIRLTAIQDSLAARVSVVGAAPAVTLSALAQFGTVGTSQLNPIGGTRVAGTSMSAVAFPAGLGARATGAAVNPTLVWFVDGDPPETVPRIRP